MILVKVISIDLLCKRLLNNNMKANYHTHCCYCDGKGQPEDYIKEALKRGFTQLGFSSHAPIKEPNDWTMGYDQVEKYMDTIKDLKDKYKGVIDIHRGLEIDFYPDENRFETFNRYNPEYTIGSVHMLRPKGFSKYFSVDESDKVFQDVLMEVFKDMEAFTREYYSTVRSLITQGGFEILGHIDLIKKFNKGKKYFSENETWYIDEVLKTLDLLAGGNIIVEVNTGAISRGVQDKPYPSLWILKECFKRDIKVCLNSDAHHPDNIECYYGESIELIKEAGYIELNTPFEIIKI